jgi:alpha-ribazole phosphatase
VLVLVRHGESTANHAGLLLGRTDAPLTERGRTQARAVGARVRGVRRLLTSPLVRARDTAALLDSGLEPVVDDRWIEVDYGEFEAVPLADVPAEVWQRWRDDPGYRPEGGESLAAVGARVEGALAELVADDEELVRSARAHVVVVSHVTPIKSAVGWVVGQGPEISWRLHLTTGSITRIGWGSAGPALHTFNEVPPT